ncbi:MAG: N-methyltryptophan oxidase, partial [Chloroflexi bacterium]|nr:N-methyltryptophan oxidase [Chloroflexota bacterium]
MSSRRPIMDQAEVIVIGLGGVGAFALRALSQIGVDALGLERFAPGHDRGSSHGGTRVFRHAYFEHPDYVPLLRFSSDDFG